MHLFLTLLGGAVLLGLFLLFGYLWGGTRPDFILAAQLFVPLWLLLSVINMWIGVAKAGYSFRDELPILGVTFIIPTLLAALAIWGMTRNHAA